MTLPNYKGLLSRCWNSKHKSYFRKSPLVGRSRTLHGCWDALVNGKGILHKNDKSLINDYEI